MGAMLRMVMAPRRRRQLHGVASPMPRGVAIVSRITSHRSRLPAVASTLPSGADAVGLCTVVVRLVEVVVVVAESLLYRLEAKVTVLDNRAAGTAF